MDAKRAGKVSERYQIPEWSRNNRPEKLEKVLSRYRQRGLFPDFPFGTDLNPEEVVLRKALKKLKRAVQRKRFPIPPLAEIRKIIAVPDGACPYLERMRLDQPHTFKERMLQRAVV